ncbi:MAG: pentapeptide repeat-containing protein [Nannocystaceae bacterium]
MADEAPKQEVKLVRKRGPILRAFLWITEPSLLKGISLGVVLSLMFTVGANLEAGWYVVSGLLLICVAMVFGVIIGHYVFENRKKKLQKNAATLLGEATAALPAISEELFNLVQTRDRHHLHNLWARFSRVSPSVRELTTLMVAMIFRVMAMSSLLAVLGGAISFAVFLATYLQVEKMTQQNDLLATQNGLITDEAKANKLAQDIDISLNVAAQRQAIVLGLVSSIDAELDLHKARKVQDGELLTAVRRDDDNDAVDRVELAPGMYRRIQRTLAQLRPYKVVDPDAGGIATEPSSPEQELLVRYLEGSQVKLEPLSLRKAYLARSDLSELELAGVDFNAARFDGAGLSKTDLSETYLEEATLLGATADEARFVGAKMTRADLRGANLVGADFSEAKMTAVDLRGAALARTTFDKADLSEANLAGALLTESDFHPAKLDRADLTGADLRAINKAPAVSQLKAANFWWLAAYGDPVAKALGLSAEQVAANVAAGDRIRKAGGEAAAAAIADELRKASPKPPGG